MELSEQAVIDYLQELVDEVAYMQVEPDQPLVVDSLAAAAVKWQVDLDLEVEIPFEDYLRGLTLRELADLIVGTSLSEEKSDVEVPSS